MKQILNPFLPLNVYIPDGEPHVFGDRVYLLGSHDKFDGNVYCEAQDYLCFSAPVDDLKDWRCDGVIYTVSQHPNGEGRYLYAPDVVRGNDGKYYLYYCLDGFDGGIHVAVSDSPSGRYEYYGFVKNDDGAPLNRFVPGDPAVINDEGTIRLYYGWSLSLVASHANRGRQGDATGERLLQAECMLFHHTREEILAEEGGSLMGAVTCVLNDDMLTVKEQPVRVVPGQFMADGTGFENHAFYEASSIRKINGTYYFIYSSMQSNELCYATSKYPDKGFSYRGTIISNGDVGYKGRKPQDRLNMTANNHGSIENINGKWYIFYHRHTNRSTFSRQACAEEISMLPDGSINQVEMTSCGLNGSALTPQGIFPAAYCCNLTNGAMPHITNRKIDDDIPYVTERNGSSLIANVKRGTNVVYKYFDFAGAYSLTLLCKGKGKFVIQVGEQKVSEVIFDNSEFEKGSCEFEASGIYELRFIYEGDDAVELSSFELTKIS